MLKSNIAGVILLVYCILIYAKMEKAYEISYMGDINHLNDSTVIAPERSVAFSNIFKVLGLNDSINGKGTPPSIFFVIDHSRSMMTETGTDPLCNRYTVPSWFIDTLRLLYPKAEVGMAFFQNILYLDPKDDPLFELCPGYKMGGYLPLLQLNKPYNGTLGYEILKKYLKIKKTGSTADLVYLPSSITPIALTNINVGMLSAKDAFTKSNNKIKDRHFVIFLSDGEATATGGPDPTDAKAYVKKVKGLPTTFTIFFTLNNEPPKELKDFINNVKNNGYSKINKNSNLWSIKSSNTKKLLIDNIMKMIVTTTTMTPDTLVVNGIQNHNFDTTTKTFTFQNHFPLNGEFTDFDYDLDYSIVTDSIDTTTGDTIKLVSDSSLVGEFKIHVQNNGLLPTHYPDPFKLDHWKRELLFSYKGNTITSFTESMNEIEIGFNFEPGTIQYEYSQVKVEITNYSSNGRDKETITLTNVTNSFKGSIHRKLISSNETPTTGDGILQHYYDDGITITFRNDEKPKLPLDTVTIKIPFQAGGTLTIDSSFYFDTNADGYVDSIFIVYSENITGSVTKTHILELVDSSLTLPEFRKFTINKTTLVSTGFYLLVTEDESKHPITYTTKEDVLKTSPFFLSNGGKVLTSTIPIQDRVAPIIHWDEKAAFLFDHALDTIADTLTVTFSEPIEIVTSTQPFHFYRHENSIHYTVKLKHIGQPDPDKMIFYVTSLDGVDYMKQNDTLWIRSGDRVSDIIGNFQNNEKNTHRKLYVTRTTLPYTFIPKAVTPVKTSSIHTYSLSKELVSVLKKQGIFKTLNLVKNNSDEYCGMVILVEPDPKNIGMFIKDLQCKGKLSVFDAVGNCIIKKEKMAWWDKRKSLVYVWNGSNTNSRTVGLGTYVAFIEIVDITESLGFKDIGKMEVKKIYLGIQQ